MLTIISFLLTLIGSVNWLLIGLLQYDFVAGIFGYQGSIFSRIIYILIGASSVVLIVKLFKGKGTIPVWTRRNKKDLSKQMAKIGQQSQANANAEASKEQVPEDEHYGDSNQRFAPPQDSQEDKSHGLFDEEFKD